MPQSVLPTAAVAGPKAPKSGELTLFGDFQWRPSVSDQEEIDLLLSGDWNPGTLDFAAVTGVPANTALGNFEALLLSIAEQRVGSIHRLNFFGHGNSLVLGIQGDIVPGNVRFTALIDTNRLQQLNDPGLTIRGTSRGKTVEFTLADIRNRFADKARMVIYACNAAVAEGFLQAMADLLQIDVFGFAAETLFCPVVQTSPPFKRTGMAIGIAFEPGGCEKNSTFSDWRMLIFHRSTVVANPTPPS